MGNSVGCVTVTSTKKDITNTMSPDGKMEVTVMADMFIRHRDRVTGKVVGVLAAVLSSNPRKDGYQIVSVANRPEGLYYDVERAVQVASYRVTALEYIEVVLVFDDENLQTVYTITLHGYEPREVQIKEL